jgi:hypothetical protein
MRRLLFFGRDSNDSSWTSRTRSKSIADLTIQGENVRKAFAVRSHRQADFWRGAFRGFFSSKVTFKIFLKLLPKLRRASPSLKNSHAMVLPRYLPWGPPVPIRVARLKRWGPVTSGPTEILILIGSSLALAPIHIQHPVRYLQFQLKPCLPCTGCPSINSKYRNRIAAKTARRSLVEGRAGP